MDENKIRKNAPIDFGAFICEKRFSVNSPQLPVGTYLHKPARRVRRRRSAGGALAEAGDDVISIDVSLDDETDVVIHWDAIAKITMQQ